MQYTRQTNFTEGTVIDAEIMDSEFNAVQGVVNGNIDTDNISDNAILEDKIANDAVTQAKISGGSLTRVLYSIVGHAVAVPSASYTDSGLTITLTVNSGSTIILDFVSVMLHKTTGNFVYTIFTRDGVEVGRANASMGLTIATPTSYSPIAMKAVITNETAGSHTYKVQWRTDAGTAETYNGAIFTLMEVRAE